MEVTANILSKEETVLALSPVLCSLPYIPHSAPLTVTSSDLSLFIGLGR